MPKQLLLILLLALSTLSVKAQINGNDALPLFQQLQQKNYKEAHKTAKALLENFGTDSSFIMGIVRYGFLYSGAALIAEEKMDYADLRPYSTQLEGKIIVMPGHPTTADTSTLRLNTNVLRAKDKAFEARTTSTNASGSSIYFFETFYFNRNLDLNRLEGLNTQCGGTLKSIQFNPNESLIWIMRLEIEEAFIQGQ